MPAIRLIHRNWWEEFRAAAQSASGKLRILCPFIREQPIRRILGLSRFKDMKVITRFNLADWQAGVSDPRALMDLLNAGAKVRGLYGLHSKLYIFGQTAILGSINLTTKAMESNHELGAVFTDPQMVHACDAHFDEIWSRLESDLTQEQLEQWQREFALASASVPPSAASADFPDYGTRTKYFGLYTGGDTRPPGARQSWVKFFGTATSRFARDVTVLEELRRSGCHWACGYPHGKRPRSVQDGSTMFLSRLVEAPNDIMIFGRGFALSYQAGRDDADAEEIRLVPWREDWPHYIRLRDTEFISGTMNDAVSLESLMKDLGSDAFVTTQKNQRAGVGNTDPRQAYRQQPGVRLSPIGYLELNRRFEAALKQHGRVPNAQIEAIGQPERSRWLSSQAKQILSILLASLQSGQVGVERVSAYYRYGQVLRAMGIQPIGRRQNGRQLQANGLDDLDAWTRRFGYPAIAGFIVSGTGNSARPGPGFFRPHNRQTTATAWWRSELAAAAAFDWQSRIGYP